MSTPVVISNLLLLSAEPSSVVFVTQNPGVLQSRYSVPPVSQNIEVFVPLALQVKFALSPTKTCWFSVSCVILISSGRKRERELTYRCLQSLTRSGEGGGGQAHVHRRFV